jgi:L-alanine-DL-glutamate epimerase-like enolase superfamily enzyme
MEVEIRLERLPLRAPIRITGYTFVDAPVLTVTLRDGEHVGCGEAAGVYYRDDTPASMRDQIEALRPVLAAGVDRRALQHLLPPGGARNALDCALWDLEARRAGAPVWRMAGLNAPKPVVTTYTIGADDPDAMADRAHEHTAARAFKLKLTGEAVDAERVRTVRAARPDAWIGVDANQGYNLISLQGMMPAFVEEGVALIEQPTPPGQDAGLSALRSPIPIAADESVLCLADLRRCIGCFDLINIKLDKCGGLTEGLEMARLAVRLGFKVMVGNMVGTSLAMAPAFLLAQLCEVVDLDGPLALAADRTPGVVYEAGRISCAESVWGGAVATAA